MTEDQFATLRRFHELGDAAVPHAVRRLAGDADLQLVWRNELGGLTFRTGDTFVKWNPLGTGVDLDRERVRMEWLAPRHPAPRVLGHGHAEDGQWLVTEALPGEHAVGDTWRARRAEAIGAIAQGLRALHALPSHEVPKAWQGQSWYERRPASLGTPPRGGRSGGSPRRRLCA